MERKHNIELLRVLSMFLVVVGHFCYNCVKLNPILGSFPIDGDSSFASKVAGVLVDSGAGVQNKMKGY